MFPRTPKFWPPVVAMCLACPALAAAQAASARLNEDGTVTIAGIVQPGRDVIVPQTCLAEPGQAEIVVCAANAFLATLDDGQRSQVLLPLAVENSTAWSNLPCGSGCRVGIQLADLDEAQRAAALAVIKAATGDYGDDGFDELTQVMMADDVLAASQASGEGGGPGAPPDGMPRPPGGIGAPPGGGGPGGYAATSYFMAFLGAPGVEDTWQLQFGGHHLALLKTYKGRSEIGDTPAFIGVEPEVWNDHDTIYGPLEDDRQAMVDMLAGLSEAQLAAARVDEMFTDILLGPGKDGQFPQTKWSGPLGADGLAEEN